MKYNFKKMDQVQEEIEKDPMVCKERGNQAFKDGYYEEAIEFYSKAIKYGEKHKELQVFYKNRAQCYLKLDEWEKAEKDCTKSLEISPRDPKALFRRCQAYESLERYEEAYKDARGVLEADPSSKVSKMGSNFFSTQHAKCSRKKETLSMILIL